MGLDPEGRDDVWLAGRLVRRVVRLHRAAPSGRRRGSRALGLGVDSLLLALKALLTASPGPYLAANPWTAVALRLLGRRDLAVTGLYASPGSRSHRILLRLLKDIPVVTLSSIEAERWESSGGRAVSVQYGNTFGYARRQIEVGSIVRIFIGGSSDRDQEVIAELEEEIHRSGLAVRLTVVDGTPPFQWGAGRSLVIHTGYVSAARFGELISDSDVVVLPLREGARAAGHMVMVGALEAGVPVLTTATEGIREYIDGTCVRALDPESPLLPQIMDVASEMLTKGSSIRDHWARKFSLSAYVQRVQAALINLEARSGGPDDG
jgi:hypothetical protein